MPVRDLAAIGKLAAPAVTPSAASAWTPDRVMQVINGVGELIKQYKTLAPMIGAGQGAAPGGLPRGVMPGPGGGGGGGIGGGQIKTAAKMLLQSLQNQGYGPVPFGQVIAAIPFTVDQMAGFIDNPIELMKALNRGGPNETNK